MHYLRATISLFSLLSSVAEAIEAQATKQMERSMMFGWKIGLLHNLHVQIRTYRALPA